MTLTIQSALRKDQRTANDMPLLQHRHFAFIAATIKKTRDPFARGITARLFADECQRSNPNFDRSRFLKACGVEP